VHDVKAPAPHRSIRARRATKKFTLLTTEHRNILLFDNDEPMSYTKAMMESDYEKCLGAMNLKYNSCMAIKFETWFIQSMV
jgi:hypothetical protein